MQQQAPERTLKHLIKTRYSNAICIFWAGSVAKHQGTPTSDLDLIIIMPKLTAAYREAFIFEGWPIDTFVHDPETLEYFFTQADPPASGLASMILEGIELTPPSSYSSALKRQVATLLAGGPSLKPDDLYHRRFQIADLLDDLANPPSPHSNWAIRAELYRQLAEFYLLSNRQWIASGKILVRLLERYNINIAQQFFKAFSQGSYKEIESLTLAVLEPQGGLLWGGYTAKASLSCRVTKESQ